MAEQATINWEKEAQDAPNKSKFYYAMLRVVDKNGVCKFTDFEIFTKAAEKFGEATLDASGNTEDKTAVNPLHADWVVQWHRTAGAKKLGIDNEMGERKGLAEDGSLSDAETKALAAHRTKYADAYAAKAASDKVKKASVKVTKKGGLGYTGGMPTQQQVQDALQIISAWSAACYDEILQRNAEPTAEALQGAKY